MPRFCSVAAGLALVALAQQPTPANAALPDQAPSRYPPAPRGPVVEAPFGVPVADPWRWLEADPAESPAVAQWLGAQSILTRKVLDALPDRARWIARVTALAGAERFGLPRKAGPWYFYTRSSADTAQAKLWARRGLMGEPQLVVDPGQWSAQGRVALGQWQASPRGKRLAFALTSDGSDWRSVMVRDLARQTLLPDRLDWVTDAPLAWVGEQGLLYSRYPAPPEGSAHRAVRANAAVWFHRLGTPQSDDQLVFATPDHPDWRHQVRAGLSPHWAAILTEAGTGTRQQVRLVALERVAAGAGPAAVATLVDDFAHGWQLVDSRDDRLWWLTDTGAANGHLVELDLSRDRASWHEVVGAGADPLVAAALVGDRLVLSYRRDGATQAVITAAGAGRGPRAVAAIPVAGNGVASGFVGHPGDPETFYQVSALDQPPAIWRLDLATGRASPFAVPQSAAAAGTYTVDEVSCRADDGTTIPVTIARRSVLAAAHQPAPTLLYGYGGFAMAPLAVYTPERMAWLEAGGVYAIAHGRGGGEFGEAWHRAGSGANRPRALADFISAGECLIANGITPRAGLAAAGSSNGATMVAAVVNRRPDLFAAALADAGVHDLLRFDRFTAGPAWVEDFGNPTVAADWQVLRGWSPYHTVRSSGRYPALLITTGDADDRVVPAHSYKLAAALQAADLGPAPRLLRVIPHAGHGGGAPLAEASAAAGEALAFLAAAVGLGPPQSQSPDPPAVVNAPASGLDAEAPAR